MFMFTADTESKVPIYHQLYSFIKLEIQLGKLPYNTKLPSKRKLSSYLNLSQNTIQNAYGQLIEEGYLIPKERKGFYINKIDNLIRINMQSEIKEASSKNNKFNIQYDFSYNGVDKEAFPYSAWRKLFKDAINEYDTDILQASSSLGNIDLRYSIAEYLHQSRGVNCSANQIVVSSGTESLMQILVQLLNKESIYGIENPGYEKLNLLFTSNNINFRALNVDEGGMSIEEVKKTDANILCITPAHQFPTGEIMPINRRIQILNWANERAKRYIVEDDYDGEFKYSGKPVPALQGLDSNEKVIYIGSFSKSLSPGIRISYMVLPKELLKKYEKDLSFLICPVPTIDQKVLHQFIRQGYFERHLNRMRNIYKKKRETLIKELLYLNRDIKVFGADAGLHLLLGINNGMTEDQLVYSALERGIRVYGISKYYFDKKHIDRHPKLLIGYATMTEAEINIAVKALGKAWFN